MLISVYNTKLSTCVTNNLDIIDDFVTTGII